MKKSKKSHKDAQGLHGILNVQRGFPKQHEHVMVHNTSFPSFPVDLQ